MEPNKKKELWRVVKFTLFSASAGLIEIASFALLNELLHLPYWLSYLIAMVLSVLWTSRSTGSSPSSRPQTSPSRC